MTKKRYLEIKAKCDELQNNKIAYIKYMLELGEKERQEYYKYKQFLEMQQFLVGIL